MFENVSLSDLRTIIQPATIDYFIKIIQKAKDENGAKWLESLRAEYENFNFIYELICECTEAEALAKLKKQFPPLRVGLFDKKISDAYRKLKFEFERKR